MTTGHTPIFGLPFPEGNEYVIGGDDAIEALALAAEAALAEHTRPRYFGASDGAVATGVGTWHPLVFTAPALSADFELHSSGTYATYVGDAGRFFTWTGAAVLSTGTDVSAKELRLNRNATAFPSMRSTAAVTSLSLATIVQLDPGDMLWVEVNTAAVAGVAGSGYMPLLGGA